MHQNAAFVCVGLVVFAAAMYLTVFLAGDVVEKLRAHERELVSVTTSLERGSLELQDAYERIKALEEKKSDVLRVAGHQLRSPLSAIRSLLDVAVEGYAVEPERQRRMLERARSRTTAMLAMVNELLVLSRLKESDRGRERSEERIDVCSILAALDELYRPKAESKGVTLVLSPPPDACAILASGDDIREALNNLLDNAINYTPTGGTVRCAARFDEPNLIVSVSDTGIGIEPETLDRVFEEFYRAPNAKKVDANGTGLGLAIVKRTIEKWHGSITVESKPGEGTTFTLVFPGAPRAG
jgi:signal transduction histidine kinase